MSRVASLRPRAPRQSIAARLPSVSGGGFLRYQVADSFGINWRIPSDWGGGIVGMRTFTD